MPRSARKESGCGIYHVMMRGVNRQAIFDDDEDCRRFMDILADLPFQHDDDGRLLPIHRHQKTSETVVCLRGRLVEEYYDELEHICTERIELSPDGPVVAQLV